MDGWSNAFLDFPLGKQKLPNVRLIANVSSMLLFPMNLNNPTGLTMDTFWLKNE